MKKLEKWTGEKTYMYPNGTLALPQMINAKYTAALSFTHVIETDEAGEVCFAVQNLSALRGVYNIDNSLSEDAAIQAIEDILNTPPPTRTPTPDERIAAAMEFQNMVTMANL